MAKARSAQVSDQVVAEAMKIARATQRPGQTKEQTQLIAKGIEKGIAEFKKQQKVRARAADKAKKQTQRQKETAAPVDTPQPVPTPEAQVSRQWLPWVLLGLSWAGFVLYLSVV